MKMGQPNVPSLSTFLARECNGKRIGVDDLHFSFLSAKGYERSFMGSDTQLVPITQFSVFDEKMR